MSTEQSLTSDLPGYAAVNRRWDRVEEHHDALRIDTGEPKAEAGAERVQQYTNDISPLTN
jgi:bisphosphoglycerate-independent phosphoglycerate mutase (AlkP superfamily)